jgi:hypothetical protein
MSAWSDPKDLVQSMWAPWKVACDSEARLCQMRSSVLSRPLFSPQWVGTPGAERRANVWVASHSLTQSAACECAQSGGDQERECRLKSPVSKVGTVGSKSSEMSVVSAEGSSTSL